MTDEDEALEAGYAELAESHAEDRDELRKIRDRALRRYDDRALATHRWRGLETLADRVYGVERG